MQVVEAFQNAAIQSDDAAKEQASSMKKPSMPLSNEEKPQANDYFDQNG